MSRRLFLFNSLTQKKELFIPLKTPTVTWYCCGPTVYDAGHMGHARSYVSFDIIRRVLADYFNFNVIFVMNITDVDDKIISRARQEYLWKNFVDSVMSFNEFKSILLKSQEIFKNKIENTFDENAKIFHTKRLELFVNSINDSSINDLYKKSNGFFSEFKDVFTHFLDVTRGYEITDHKIYSALTRKFEKDFLDDLNSLEILPPTFMPRVTEFVENIIKYILVIIENEYAYESNGSVYFDTIKFSKTHKYAKLVPSAANDLNSLAIGEGELTTNVHLSEKRSARDFALWKVSKSGEPFWESPWGRGRPGWHIECSTMCHEILPSQIDIHSGGVDLKFPHHDNEISQSEAFYNCENWVSVFLHSGHLTIEGCKMSKSLKNFITIKEALKSYSARQLRLLFLIHQWNGPLDFSSNMMIEVLNLDRRISDFISRINSLIEYDSEIHNVYGIAEKKLQNEFEKTHENIDSSICDNIDTCEAMNQIKNLISCTYTYIATKNNLSLHNFLLESIKNYLIKILSIFGAKYSEYSSKNPNENITMKLAHKVANFRSDVRKIGFETKNKCLFELCDKFRDLDLFELGIKLEDSEERSTVIISSKAKLENEREEKNKSKMLEIKNNEQFLEINCQKQAKKNKNDEFPIHPSMLFRDMLDKYSTFDSNGLPVLDSMSQPVTKSAMKKIMKMYEKQKVIYERYLSDKSSKQ